MSYISVWLSFPSLSHFTTVATMSIFYHLQALSLQTVPVCVGIYDKLVVWHDLFSILEVCETEPSLLATHTNTQTRTQLVHRQQ